MNSNEIEKIPGGGSQTRNLAGYIDLIKNVFDLLPDGDLVKKARNRVPIYGADLQRGLFPGGHYAYPAAFECSVMILGTDESREKRNSRRSQLEMILHNSIRRETLMDLADLALSTLTSRELQALRFKYQLDPSVPALSNREIGAEIKNGMGRRGARAVVKRGINHLRADATVIPILAFLDGRPLK